MSGNAPHPAMTLAEGVGLVTRIALYYPGWLKGLGEEEVKRTMLAWAGELAPLGEREEVWEHLLDCLRTHQSPWPPGVFELRRYIAGRLKAKRERQNRLAPPPITEETATAAKTHLAEIFALLDGKGKAHARQRHTRAMGDGEAPRRLAQPHTRMDDRIP